MLTTKKFMIGLLCLGILLTISSIASAQYDWDYSGGEEWALFGLGCAVAGMVVWFIIALLLAIWVYRDAEKRGSSGALWLIIVLIANIIGLIVWLVVRPPIGGGKKEPDRRCPNCGRAIPNDARSCPYCNKKFEE